MGRAYQEIATTVVGTYYCFKILNVWIDANQKKPRKNKGLKPLVYIIALVFNLSFFRLSEQTCL